MRHKEMLRSLVELSYHVDVAVSSSSLRRMWI